MIKARNQGEKRKRGMSAGRRREREVKCDRKKKKGEIRVLASNIGEEGKPPAVKKSQAAVSLSDKIKGSCTLTYRETGSGA